MARTWYFVSCVLAALVLLASGFSYLVIRDVGSIGASHAIASGPSAGAQNILLMGLESRRDWNGNILPGSILAKLHAGNAQAVANGTGSPRGSYGRSSATASTSSRSGCSSRPSRYAFTVLRGVRGTAQTSSFVPQVAVTVSFLLVAVSALVFLIYIHHMANSVRAATIITKIGNETRKLLDEVLPEEAPTPPLVDAAGTSANWTPVLAARSGVIQQVDLAALASSADAGAVRVARAIGEFVPAGAVVLHVEGTDDPDATALLRAVHFGRERSMDEDPGFGIRQLVDMAERALSPGVNDPTTAVQALDQIHDLLRQIVRRPVPPYRCHVEDGRSVVLLPQPTVEDYLALGLDEIAHWSADSDRVRRRIAVLLDNVAVSLGPSTGRRSSGRSTALACGT